MAKWRQDDALVQDHDAENPSNRVAFLYGMDIAPLRSPPGHELRRRPALRPVSDQGAKLHPDTRDLPLIALPESEPAGLLQASFCGINC